MSVNQLAVMALQKERASQSERMGFCCEIRIPTGIHFEFVGYQNFIQVEFCSPVGTPIAFYIEEYGQWIHKKKSGFVEPVAAVELQTDTISTRF
jgi:hypothetical protein